MLKSHSEVQTEQQRRQDFVAQVRRAIGSSLKDLSQRQKDLLDGAVSDLYRQNRPISDEEIQGELEVITDFVSLVSCTGCTQSAITPSRYAPSLSH